MKKERKKKQCHTVFCLKLFQWQSSRPTFYFVPCCDPIPIPPLWGNIWKILVSTKGTIWQWIKGVC